MRILYDARSVRTPAGMYVFQGLTGAWAADARVDEVIAAVPEGFDRSRIPAGVKPVNVTSASWIAHVLQLPRLADRHAADVIFAPNGIAPRDHRSVIYFQDLFHFRPRISQRLKVSSPLNRSLRAAWRRLSSSVCMLAVAVSREILAEVSPRVRIPTFLIPNGVDVGDRWWRGERERVFVMGGIGDRKDEATALKAWTMLPRDARGATVLEIAGVEPAERKESLTRLARSHGLADSVIIDGGIPREDFLERMQCARLSISCSRLEAFGLPVAEALAMGAPLLCSDLPAHEELLERAGGGQSFVTGDAQDLARKMERALCAEPPARVREPLVGWSWAARAKEHLDRYRARH